MISWQAMTLNGILRWTMKRHGRKPINLSRLRRHPAKFALAIPDGFVVETVRPRQDLSFDVVRQATTGAALAAGTAVSAGAAHAKAPVIVLYLHGGGYIFGSPKTHRQALIAMARAFEAPVYGLDYRLAPEHPFPAAVDDAELAYHWLLQEYPDSSIVLAGDSAGAGLAVATALVVRQHGWKQAAAIVGFSPYCDLAVTGDSIEANVRSCAMFTPRGVREAAAMYLAGADPRDPRASPLYADLTGLPPMLLFASRHELLRDDTLRLAERAKACGVPVQLIVRDRLPHVWPVFVSLLPEAREAFTTVAAFARQLATPRAEA